MWLKIGTGALVLVAGGLLSCQNAETKECQRLMAEAQVVVKEVDSKSAESVAESLGAVELAILACEKAERHEEVDQLLKAKNEFSGHLAYLERRKGEKAGKKLTPEEIEQLVKDGDPDCPKGQAYKHRQSGKEIRCKGAQPVDMNWKKAEEYYKGRGYKMSSTKSPPSLTAEYGAELLVYRFESENDSRPATCIEVYPRPGMHWQDTTCRLTGVPPQRLDIDKPVRTSRGQMPLKIVDNDKKVVVKIGSCGD